MTITALPTAPTPSDSAQTFNTRAFALVAALAQFVAEANQMGTDLNTVMAAALAAVAGSNAEVWESGADYTIGDSVWSPTNYLPYRRRTDGAGTTDPADDETNWAQIGGTGDVSTNSPATLTNKTLVDLILTGKVAEQVYTLAGTELNPANGTIQVKTITADTTFTANIAAGESLTLHLIDGDSWAVTWPTITWTRTGAVAPSLTAADVVVLWKVGATLYGHYAGTFE